MYRRQKSKLLIIVFAVSFAFSICNKNLIWIPPNTKDPPQVDSVEFEIFKIPINKIITNFLFGFSELIHLS